VLLSPGITLYFVRHGETDWNRLDRYQGQIDIALNDTGRAQAARNGRALAELLNGSANKVDYVSSPLLRARETMQIVRCTLNLPPDDYRVDHRLREMEYGHWEGQRLRDLPTTDPAGFAGRKADPWNWQPRGGESYRMVSERIARWLGGVERDTVVVSHGGVSKVLRGVTGRLSPCEVPFLKVPQDQVLVLTGTGMRWH
jgi:probable phosphoglycerate mutase